MEYVSLGRTGVQVSRICLGTMNFGGRTGPEDATAILGAAASAGINFIDTANVYGHVPDRFAEGRGRSEEILGRWLRNRRDDYVVATKMYFPMSDRPGAMGPSARNVIAECEASLRRLGTDYVDLYQLHHPSNDVPIDETLRALDQLVTAGKVRYVGTSSFAAWQLVEALWAAKTGHLAGPSCEQPVYNLLDRRAERELLPMARTYGIGVITWSPLAGGVLAGRYARGQAPPEGSRHETFWKGRHEALTAEVFDALDQLRQLSTQASIRLHDLAYAWLLRQPGVTSVIAGPRTVDHLAGAVSATGVELSDELVAAIDEVIPPGGVVLRQYGHDGFSWVPWGPHQAAWR
jgi:aryl-alcohol dehydrogenase-like predicted oxidoreductase